MKRTFRQLLRPLVPNVTVRIRHAEPNTNLEVRLREQLGLVVRGAGAYEPKYVEVLRALLQPNDTVFDVGANIGFYSVLFSRWVGPTGTVVAYEPDPENTLLLKRNLVINKCKNVVVREIALAQTSGKNEFSLDRSTRSTGHLGPGPTYGDFLFGQGAEEFITVDTFTLEQESERWGPPHLIKLDIEGSEYDVLCGGRRLLAYQGPYIVSELNCWNGEAIDGISKASRATSLLSEQGYVLWNLDNGLQIDGGDVAWMMLAHPRMRLNEPRLKNALRILNSI